MKQRVFLAAGLLLPMWLVPNHNCSRIAVAPEAASSTAAGVTPTPAPDLFATAVRPILAGHCAPCHEPGGVMYERLPFDHADVVASHSTGVLKRIKEPEERAAIERWLASQPKG
jgi:hypothetical protein